MGNENKAAFEVGLGELNEKIVGRYQKASQNLLALAKKYPKVENDISNFFTSEAVRKATEGDFESYADALTNLKKLYENSLNEIQQQSPELSNQLKKEEERLTNHISKINDELTELEVTSTAISKEQKALQERLEQGELALKDFKEKVTQQVFTKDPGKFIEHLNTQASNLKDEEEIKKINQIKEELNKDITIIDAYFNALKEQLRMAFLLAPYYDATVKKYPGGLSKTYPDGTPKIDNKGKPERYDFRRDSNLANGLLNQDYLEYLDDHVTKLANHTSNNELLPIYNSTWFSFGRATIRPTGLSSFGWQGNAYLGEDKNGKKVIHVGLVPPHNAILSMPFNPFSWNGKSYLDIIRYCSALGDQVVKVNQEFAPLENYDLSNSFNRLTELAQSQGLKVSSLHTEVVRMMVKILKANPNLDIKLDSSGEYNAWVQEARRKANAGPAPSERKKISDFNFKKGRIDPLLEKASKNGGQNEGQKATSTPSSTLKSPSP